MHILPYTIANTNDLLTGRGGLVCVAELMRQIGFSSWVERYFPRPGSNRGYQPAEIVTLWMLMLHEGARCLEDVRHLRRDRALRKLLGLRRLPSADMLGDWLRRLGQDAVGINALVEVNRRLLKLALRGCVEVTLDIDATPALAAKRTAQRTYLGEKGYMPMLGHIEATGQETCQGVWAMDKYKTPFTLVVQRCRKGGQQALDLDEGEDGLDDETTMTDGRYIYRELATNRNELTESEIVHWYNQRGEDSENRIKELKSDFAGERLPCEQFDANALYFHLCVTAYNLFVLLRHALPPEWHTCRAPTFRWRVYALAAKVVSHARRVYLKFQPDQADLIKTLLAASAPPERPAPLPGAA